VLRREPARELPRFAPVREPVALEPARELLDRELLREPPPRFVVRLLRALVPPGAPLPREERDSPAPLRWLLRPDPEARPRALEDFFACAPRPLCDFLAAVREPPPVRALREEPLPDALLREEREPLEAVVLRDEVLRDDEAAPREDDFLLCERLPLLPPLLLRDWPERPEFPRSACAAVSRLTILLKLLRSPAAVVSWYSRARPRSSNLSNQSSQLISSSEPAPL